MLDRNYLVHDERMAEFRRAAAKERLVRLARLNRTANLPSQRPLIVITPRSILSAISQWWLDVSQPHLRTISPAHEVDARPALRRTTFHNGSMLWSNANSTYTPTCSRMVRRRRLRTREAAQAAARRLARG